MGQVNTIHEYAFADVIEESDYRDARVGIDAGHSDDAQLCSMQRFHGNGSHAMNTTTSELQQHIEHAFVEDSLLKSFDIYR